MKKRAPLFEILDCSVNGIHSWNDLVMIFLLIDLPFVGRNESSK